MTAATVERRPGDLVADGAHRQPPSSAVFAAIGDLSFEFRCDTVKLPVQATSCLGHADLLTGEIRPRMLMPQAHIRAATKLQYMLLVRCQPFPGLWLAGSGSV